MLIRDPAAFDRQDVGDANLRICVRAIRLTDLLKAQVRRLLMQIEDLLEHRSLLSALTAASTAGHSPLDRRQPATIMPVRFAGGGYATLSLFLQHSVKVLEIIPILLPGRASHFLNEWFAYLEAFLDAGTPLFNENGLRYDRTESEVEAREKKPANP